MRSSHFIFYLAINIFAMFGVAIAWLKDLHLEVWHADTSRLSIAICALFILGFILTTKYMAELGSVLHGARGPLMTRRSLLMLYNCRTVSSSLVLLGLIGTVIGFVQVFSAVSPETVSSIESIPKTIALLQNGMSTALYTTLIGAITSLWTIMNTTMIYNTMAAISAARSHG